MRRARQRAVRTNEVRTSSAPQNASNSRISGEVRQLRRHVLSSDSGEGVANATRVLLVDNNPQICWVVRNALRSYGYGVSEARNSDEAFEMLQKEKYVSRPARHARSRF